jgi:hypothetical protein
MRAGDACPESFSGEKETPERIVIAQIKPLTKVLFRLEKQSGEVLAVFPELPATLAQAHCTGYAQLGQHCEVSLDYVRQQTTPATRSQYRSLARELRQRGYRLAIRRRLSPPMHRARQAAITRWQAGKKQP